MNIYIGMEIRIIDQREVGFDTNNFANGLRAALRQDPDVILVGEMRDLETISNSDYGSRNRSSCFWQHFIHQVLRQRLTGLSMYFHHPAATNSDSTSLCVSWRLFHSDYFRQ